MTVPKGFTVTLAAAEPDVVRPIAFALDDRGRLWVAEAHTYPVRAAGRPGQGPHPDLRGHRRRRTARQAQGVHGGAEPRQRHRGRLRRRVGRRGAVPAVHSGRRRRRTCPTGPPQVLLDGWGYQDTHETLNTFSWGPDGWLYGSHGVFTHSNVGKPGTPDCRTPAAQRRRSGAITRRRHVFEVFAEGTSNPWGLDFNDYGHAFTTACVIEHLYHVIQGARYQRQAGKHFNPVHLRRHQDHRRPRALGRQQGAARRATAARTRPAAATPTPAR